MSRGPATSTAGTRARFRRATYGSPQSNGCVEMRISDAAKVWPLAPIGTLVTVVGPPS